MLPGFISHYFLYPSKSFKSVLKIASVQIIIFLILSVFSLSILAKSVQAACTGSCSLEGSWCTECLNPKEQQSCPNGAGVELAYRCVNKAWAYQYPQCSVACKPDIIPTNTPAPACPGSEPNNCAIYECPDGCQYINNGVQPECRTFVKFADCNTLTKNSVSDCGQIDYLKGPKSDYCGVMPGTQCRNGTNSCQTQPSNPPRPTKTPTRKPTKTPTRKPTKTPTGKLTRTPTPISAPSCDQITIEKRAGSPGNTIKIGDTVRFTAYGTTQGVPIISFKFVLTLKGSKLFSKKISASRLPDGRYTGYTDYTLNQGGDHTITVTVLTK